MELSINTAEPFSLDTAEPFRLDYVLFADYTILLILIILSLVIGLITLANVFKSNIYTAAIKGMLVFLTLKLFQTFWYSTADNTFVNQIILYLTLLLVIYYFIVQEEQHITEIRWEFPILTLCAFFGILLSLEHTEGIAIFLGLEIQAFCYYTMVSLKEKNIFSSEGALKYFLIGAIASGLFILGLGLVYSAVAKTEFVQITEIILQNKNEILRLGGLLLIVGLLFKIGAAPFHLWLPDAYQGAPFYVLIFLLTFPKITLFYLIFTLNNIFPNNGLMFLTLVASAIVGALQALQQSKIKRFIAYSVIFNNAFFLSITFLSGYGAFLSLIEAISLYLMMTLTTTLCFFNLRTANSEEHLLNLRDLISLKKSNIFIALILMLGFFSSAGIPPFIGFFQKYILLLALVEKAQFFLMVILIQSAILPAYYYIRMSKIIFFLTQAKHILLENIKTIHSNIIAFFAVSLTMVFL